MFNLGLLIRSRLERPQDGNIDSVGKCGWKVLGSGAKVPPVCQPYSSHCLSPASFSARMKLFGGGTRLLPGQVSDFPGFAPKIASARLKERKRSQEICPLLFQNPHLAASAYWFDWSPPTVSLDLPLNLQT